MTNAIRNCKFCGAALKPGAQFCVKCGQPIPAEPPPPPAPPVQPVLVPPSPPSSQTGNVPPVFPVPPNPPAPIPPAFTPPTPPAQSTPAIPPPMPSPQEGGQPPISAPLTPPPVAEERVVHVIGMLSRKTGVFSAVIYHMVLTNQRLIFALQTKEMQKQDVIDARDAAKQQGKGFFGQVGAQMASRSGQKYLACNPNSILAENPGNFEVPLNQLKGIETYNGDFDDNEPDSMVVKTFSDKFSFNIQSAHAVRGELKPYLGNIIK